MEGNEAHLDSLKNTGFPFHVGLLADDEKDVKYYKVANVSEDMNTVNSMFKEAGWSEELGVTAQASTVDKIVEGAGAGTFNLMKIDVQGAEVLVLKGSQSTLKNVDVIATEASIQNYNDGGADFYELHSAMNENGFGLYDVIDMFRFDPRDKHLIQIDFLWVRKSSHLWDRECTGFKDKHKSATETYHGAHSGGNPKLLSYALVARRREKQQRADIKWS